jgi:PAS domain S-box-containing protein
MKDLNGRFLMINKHIEERYGWRLEDTREKTNFDILDDKNLAALLKDLQEKVMETREPAESEVETIGKDGTSRSLLLIDFPIFSSDGELVGIGGFDHDITDHKRAEAALQQSQQRFKDFAEASADWFWEMDSELRFSYMSPNVERIVGVPPEWHYGKTRQDILGDDCDRTAWDEHLRTLRAHEPFRNFTYLRAGEGVEPRWLRTSGVPVFGADGTFLGYRGSGSDVTAAVEAEQALSEAEERFRAIFEQAAVGIGLMTPGGRFLAVNRKLCEIMSREAEELLALRFEEFTHPDDYRSCIVQVARLVAGEIPTFSTEMRYVHQDGKLLWGTLTISVIREPGSNRFSLLGIVEDITERRQAEVSLRESEARFSKAFQSSPDLISISGLEDGLLYDINDKWASTMGFTREEAIGKTVFELGVFVDPSRRTEFVEALKTDETVRDLEFQGRTKSGEIRDFLAAIEKIELDGGPRLLFVSHDITERKRAETALRANEARFKTILDHAPMQIYLKDTEGRHILVNREVERHYGGPGGSMVGKTAHDLFPKENADIHLAHDREVFDSGRAIEREYEIPHEDGVHTFLALKFPIPDADGEVRTIGAFTADITDRKRLEDQFRQAQKMEAVGQLTGGIAHDFNNLLTVILGNIEFLEDMVDADPTARIYAETALKAAERGADLTHRLLAFSRKQTLNPVAVDINKLVAGTTHLLKRTLGEDTEIETVLALDLWEAMVDPNQLENAIVNLAVNARDAMAEGGKLTIETLNVRLDRDYPGSRGEVTPGQYVMVAVSDSGSGMAPEVMERVFDPFFTTKKVGEGTGLGLSMVYGFVKQSGGHVSVYSEVGEGTTIKLYIPKAKHADLSQRPAKGGRPVVPTGDETILVVEDDPDVRAFAVAALGSLGYQVLEAGDGPAALALIESRRHVDLVLADVVLPGGMNGREIAEQIQKRLPGVEVLFTSGYTENAIVHQGRLDEGVELLAKPYTRQSLARSVRQMLDAGNGEQR